MVVLEYNNMHALPNAWELEEGDAVARDAEDLVIFNKAQFDGSIW